jgi:hypothetical protein
MNRTNLNTPRKVFEALKPVEEATDHPAQRSSHPHHHRHEK